MTQIVLKAPFNLKQPTNRYIPSCSELLPAALL